MECMRRHLCFQDFVLGVSGSEQFPLIKPIPNPRKPCTVSIRGRCCLLVVALSNGVERPGGVTKVPNSANADPVN